MQMFKANGAKGSNYITIEKNYAGDPSDDGVLKYSIYTKFINVAPLSVSIWY